MCDVSFPPRRLVGGVPSPGKKEREEGNVAPLPPSRVPDSSPSVDGCHVEETTGIRGTMTQGYEIAACLCYYSLIIFVFPSIRQTMGDSWFATLIFGAFFPCMHHPFLSPPLSSRANVTCWSVVVARGSGRRPLPFPHLHWEGRRRCRLSPSVRCPLQQLHFPPVRSAAAATTQQRRRQTVKSGFSLCESHLGRNTRSNSSCRRREMAGERETDGRTGKKRAPGAAWPQTLLLCCKIPLRSPPPAFFCAESSNHVRP